MCLIIRHPPNVNFPDENLEAVWQKNKDGWGIMFAEDGRVRVIKSLENSAFLSFYKQVKHLPLGIHFRFRTHGDIDLENCHPYMILNKEQDGRDLYMMHNGTISGREVVKSKSDTWHYVEYVLRPMLKSHPDLLHNHTFRRWVTGDVGGSKLLFLDGEGNFVTLNETSGLEAFGCWLSNGHSHHPTKRGPAPYHGSNYGSNSVNYGSSAASGSHFHGGFDELSEAEQWEIAYGMHRDGTAGTASSSSGDVCQIGGGAQPAKPVDTFPIKPAEQQSVGDGNKDTTTAGASCPIATPDTAASASASVDLSTGEVTLGGAVGVVGSDEKVGEAELTHQKMGFEVPSSKATVERINSALGDAIAEAARKRALQSNAVSSAEESLQEDGDDEAEMRQPDADYMPSEPTYLEMLMGRKVEIDELDIDILRRLSRIEIDALCYNEPETVRDILLGELGRIPYASA